jgi:hypothetical protein
MSAAGYAVRETDPFTDSPAVALSFRETSPYVNRIRILWQKMRDPAIESFPEALGLPRNRAAYMKRVEEAYVTDAYHSLSIEGYRVTPELIRKVRSGRWNPDANELDRDQRNAMAARGYWQAFQLAPSVTVGLLKPSDLAGYRSGQVFIRNSMHVPLNRDGHTALRAQHLYGRSREGQCRRGHRAVRRISSRARPEGSCRKAGAASVASPTRRVD